MGDGVTSLQAYLPACRVTLMNLTPQKHAPFFNSTNVPSCTRVEYKKSNVGKILVLSHLRNKWWLSFIADIRALLTESEITSHCISLNTEYNRKYFNAITSTQLEQVFYLQNQIMHTPHTQQYSLLLHVSAVTTPSSGIITHQLIVDILKYGRYIYRVNIQV